jgi:trigger factor
MPYTLTSRVNHTIELSARLDAATVEKEREQILVSLRRQATVPGFRPGKAPLQVVRSRFADEIRNELEQSLEGVIWREVMEGESHFKPLTSPRIQDRGFDDDGSFRYTAAVEVHPRFELPSAEGLSLPEVSLDVAAAEVEAELAKIRQEQATWEPADGEPAVDGIMVEANLRGEVVGAEEEPFEEERAQFILGDEGVPTEINAGLQGVRSGEERIVEKQFAVDDANPKRAGKTVHYRVQVTALKRKLLPEVDEELARTVGFDSLDALRERVREVLGQQKRSERRRTWRRSLLDQLEEGISPDGMPPSLVSSALREDMNRFAYSMAMRGMAPDSEQINWQELAARLEPAVRRRVLDDLVLEQLAEAWEIEVPEETVESIVREQAERLGVPPGEHRADLVKDHRLDELRHAARMSATVDELLRRAGAEVDS